MRSSPCCPATRRDDGRGEATVMTLGKNALLDVHALAQSVHASASPLAPFREALRGAREALVGVGGYGRGELHPASDIDLMLLLDKDGPEKVREFVETLIRFLWDMGLEVGHSVRTVKDCVREARADLSVATNLMEARLLAGDAGLFERMRAAVHRSEERRVGKECRSRWA